MRLFQRAARIRDDLHRALRIHALQAPGRSFEISPTADWDEPWAVMMDWGIADGTIAVVTLRDGSASVSMSCGGGSTGGRSGSAIRPAAPGAVSAASEVLQEMQPATEYPLPAAGNVAFDVRTDAGSVSESISVEEVSSGNHRLSKLGNAMQLVIARSRKLES